MRERLRGWLDDGADPAAGKLAWRPALVPGGTSWARWALVLLLVFTFARGALWATTTPSFWGPDEDYHAMYAESIAREGRIISPGRPLYSNEYVATLDWTEFNVYGAGGHRAFEGDPKATLKRLARFPKSGRQATETGRGVGVVHPPLYYGMTGAVDATMLGHALPTRLFWMRIVSVLFGVLAVYGSWLLASVVLRRSVVLPLACGLIVALQPMIAFFSGLVSNDAPAIAMFTLALAALAHVLARSPVPRQGLWIGLPVALALAMKSTALALLPLVAVALVLQGAAFGGWRRVGRSAGLASALVLVLVGWWYVYSWIDYGSLTGEVKAALGEPRTLLAALDPVAAPLAAASLGDYFGWTRSWLADAYKTGWFHYLNFESPRGRWFYFLPGALIALCSLGLAGLLWSLRRRWREPGAPLVRQLALLAIAPLTLILPFLLRDLSRKSDGLEFLNAAGRFVLPSYPAAVVCAVCALLWLFRREAQALVIGAVVALSAWFCALVWSDNYFDRYFGEASFGEQLRRMSFDRPTFITQTSLTVWIALTLATLVALAALLVVHGRRERRAAPGRIPTSP
jgi:hypothetical protein